MRNAILLLAFATTVTAQVPQGWYVFGTFGSAGQRGLFLAHPRTPGQPTEITGLQGDLIVTGSSCTLYRPSDGAILVGERSPTGASVDLHVIELDGTSVRRDASFSVGVGGSCCGEIPQMGLLPDGRVVIAATDVAAGPLSNYLTTSYGYQGLGIVDTSSGLVTSIPITNGAQIVDVFNGLALAPDASSVFVGTYVSSTQGDIWQVPLPAGGAATLVATVPAGLSNLAFDNNGELWVTTLDANQGLFRVDVTTGAVTHVPTMNGALNAIALDPVTGTFAVASASRGLPARSIFWMEPNGTEHLLAMPGYGTPSGISIHLNPARFGTASGKVNSYDWVLAPNPGGLPMPGNSNFSLTVVADNAAPQFGLALLSAGGLAQPVPIFGIDLWVDMSKLIDSAVLTGTMSATLPLPVPNVPALSGAKLFIQSLHFEMDSSFGASPGVRLTVL